MKLAAALLCLVVAPPSARAQKPVPITSEPHHHQVFSSRRLRVFRVEVPAHGATLVHEHTVDYFWIAVGASEFVNASVGKPEAGVVAADGSIHFTRGNFAHLARVDGAQAFHNVTIELPDAQTNPRNLCEPAVADQPLDCDAATKRAAALYTAAGVHPAFETDQVRVTLITIAPHGKLELAKHKHAPILIAADDAPGPLTITCPVADQTKGLPLQARFGNTYRLAGNARCTVQNTNRQPVRFLAVEFAPPPRKQASGGRAPF